VSSMLLLSRKDICDCVVLVPRIDSLSVRTNLSRPYFSLVPSGGIGDFTVALDGVTGKTS
jgi:hypothetical protein